ncbi:MAG TPA: hypothetical protein VMF30_01520 [Pirellulales bacterium]|nr:hypothetical protein [Pirellulales bacterium]
MQTRLLALLVMGSTWMTAEPGKIWARGFGGGGFHGGGDFGGFHGADFGGFRDDGFGAARDGGWGGERFDGGFDRFNAGAYAADRADVSHYNPSATPSRQQLNRFLGLPSDEGFHQFAAGSSAAAGNRATGNWATGGGWSRPDGAPGRWTPQQRQTWANNVRNHFDQWGAYNGAWYQNHPDAWLAEGWGAGAAWNAASWAAVGAWFGDYGGYGGYGAGPIDYDYGNNIVYQNGDVYIDGQDADTAAQYYDQVADQAESGATAQVSETGDWLPLGVFALTSPGEEQSGDLVQLAVNKQGIVRGNYTDTVSDSTAPIEGSIDKQTQRVAWTIGDNQTTVMEAGLYNLTQPEAPVMMHFGADKAQQWLLVRLNPQGQSGSAAQSAPTAN